MLESWGRRRDSSHKVMRLSWLGEGIPQTGSSTMLAYGLGRSYGDECLNDGGVLLETRRLRRFVRFDRERGLLCCEAGVTLAEILDLIVPHNWFLPVLPGTKYITVGGAVANDVHGKNHHCAGTFGRHVTGLEILRSDGYRFWCSGDIRPDLFKASIGGLGLTGLLGRAEIQLKRVEGPYIEMESLRFRSLDELFALSEISDKDYEYTVSWLDLSACAGGALRGILMRGSHSTISGSESSRRTKHEIVSLPLDAPECLLNPWSLRAFNCLYFARGRKDRVRRTVHYDSFFFPLDVVGNWNRLYGKRGFYQFQCVVPRDAREGFMRELLRIVSNSRCPCFLAILKEFGALPSPGLLSFPRPGLTVCLDFPDRGKPTLELLRLLERLSIDHAGALYPAKDACMSPASFERSFPRLSNFRAYVDAHFSSTFWRRVQGETLK